jgi:hypothetical protein
MGFVILKGYICLYLGFPVASSELTPFITLLTLMLKISLREII